jgi:transposase
MAAEPDPEKLKRAMFALPAIVTKAAAKRARSAATVGSPNETERRTPAVAARSPSQRRRTMMAAFCGLDVSLKSTSLCVIDEDGAVVLEREVDTEPDAIADALRPFGAQLRKVGHEAGALAPWLQMELTELGVPIVLLEARHARAALKAQRNKTDKSDARGLAQIVRTGWYKEAHVKSAASYRLRLLLSNRRNLKRKCLDLENAVRHSLKAFGIKLAVRGRADFDAKVREAVKDDPVLTGLCEAMLAARAALWEQYARLHKLLVQVTLKDELCARFMEIPGVGPVTALAFKTGVDDPTRFSRSRAVGAHFGLTSRRWQSGTSVDTSLGISKQGDGTVRTALYEAASALMTRCKVGCALKSWGLKLAARIGHKKAVTAVARRLAVIMLAMWRDGTRFDFGEVETKPEKTRTAHRKAKKQRLMERARIGAPV